MGIILGLLTALIFGWNETALKVAIAGSVAAGIAAFGLSGFEIVFDAVGAFSMYVVGTAMRYFIGWIAGRRRRQRLKGVDLGMEGNKKIKGDLRWTLNDD